MDVNCIFPIERFRELEEEGYIGELAPVNYTIMGRIFRRTALQNEIALEITKRLKKEGVNVFLLVPA
jgi:D-proline reductase (dithiol) PrdB